MINHHTLKEMHLNKQKKEIWRNSYIVIQNLLKNMQSFFLLGKNQYKSNERSQHQFFLYLLTSLHLANMPKVSENMYWDFTPKRQKYKKKLNKWATASF